MYVCTHRLVAVNGQPMKMIDDVTLPAVKAVSLDLSQGITLPATSFGFFVLADAKAAACF